MVVTFGRLTNPLNVIPGFCFSLRSFNHFLDLDMNASIPALGLRRGASREACAAEPARATRSAPQNDGEAE
ncbi:MAG: hypothetical protein FWG15_06550 [Propionibacteriaceae bacterium]|nr:hypothetical protein [Propionibacteriaceae bacterium]